MNSTNRDKNTPAKSGTPTPEQEFTKRYYADRLSARQLRRAISSWINEGGAGGEAL